ncbi:hypothetical protein AAG570_010040 [Ranatra chinensis]|uniref:Cuticle protein CPCFC domain-containing protein n=1 Tax=Ranatra chinensis TaxID=642074 RepID=A0ABD0YZL0_9HEMI
MPMKTVPGQYGSACPQQYLLDLPWVLAFYSLVEYQFSTVSFTACSSLGKRFPPKESFSRSTLKTASKRRNIFGKNTKQETTERGRALMVVSLAMKATNNNFFSAQKTVCPKSPLLVVLVGVVAVGVCAPQAQYPAGVSPHTCPNYPFCDGHAYAAHHPWYHGHPHHPAPVYPPGVDPHACPDYPFCTAGLHHGWHGAHHWW